jgi:hypothetical protein
LRFGVNGNVAKSGNALRSSTDAEDSARLDAIRHGGTWMARMKRAMTIFFLFQCFGVMARLVRAIHVATLAHRWAAQTNDDAPNWTAVSLADAASQHADEGSQSPPTRPLGRVARHAPTSVRSTRIARRARAISIPPFVACPRVL